jgi:hypothetical protein
MLSDTEGEEDITPDSNLDGGKKRYKNTKKSKSHKKR